MNCTYCSDVYNDANERRLTINLKDPFVSKLLQGADPHSFKEFSEMLGKNVIVK